MESHDHDAVDMMLDRHIGQLERLRDEIGADIRDLQRAWSLVTESHADEALVDPVDMMLDRHIGQLERLSDEIGADIRDLQRAWSLVTGGRQRRSPPPSGSGSPAQPATVVQP